MSTLSLSNLQRAQVLTAVSKRRYVLTEPASSHHPYVWLARSESDGARFIIKSSLRPHESEQKKAMHQLNTEIAILKGPLRNIQGIRQLVDCVKMTDGQVEQSQAGIFEYLKFDLHRSHMTNTPRLSRFLIKSIARQILAALSKIHKQNIVHTDLKPENIVFSEPTSSDASSGFLVKLIDFGVASQKDEDRCRMITNPFWRSPESWVGMTWGTPTDIWSFGAIIGSLLMEPGAKLFQPMGGLSSVPRENRDREFLRALWTMISFPKSFLERIPREWYNDIIKFSPKLAPNGVPVTLSFIGDIFEIPEADWAFVADVLQVDPNSRPTAEELLHHPWLNS